MTIERARELGIEGTEEEIRLRIARDKDAMRTFLKIITQKGLTDKPNYE